MPTTLLRRMLVVLAVVLAVVPVAAACAGQQSRATVSQAAGSSSTTSTGILTGHLYGVGGAAPGLPQAWPGTITITGPGGQRDIPVGADGAYSVALAPGPYSVVGHSPLYGNGTYLCRAPSDVQITARNPTTLNTYCSMR